MSKKIDVFKKAKIKLSGIFDLKELYRYAHNWLEQEHKYDVVEKKYDEKVGPNGTTYLINWECTREIDMYTQFVLKVDWDLQKVKNVTVERGGEKVKMQEGKFSMIVTAQLELDYENKWEEKPFFKFMQGFYEKYLYKDSIDRLKTKCWEEGWEFINEVKAFMHLYQYT